MATGQETQLEDLRKHYECLEKRYRASPDCRYATLVVPNGNASQPFHRWFHLKEGFSSDLLRQVLADCGLAERKDLVLLDPFAGVGTAIVSGLQLDGHVEAHGIERNPFLHLVAETKVRAMTEELPELRKFFGDVVRAVEVNAVSPDAVPALSTFSNSSFFRPSPLSELLKLRRSIVETPGPDVAKALALVALGASIEPCSRLRRDGRALRYEPAKSCADPLDHFRTRIGEMLQDVSESRSASRGFIHLGDGRIPASVLPALKADLVVFSPPYPNNIDYTEVYKLENWFLGFIGTSQQFREQRLLTLRSHPSVRFPETYGASSNGYGPIFERLLHPLLTVADGMKGAKWRARLIRGYFDDMFETLSNVREFLADDGHLVYVVGNSLHGAGEKRLLIAADVMIARLAEIAGFTVECIKVARQPRRRRHASTLLRESVVFLRKR